MNKWVLLTAMLGVAGSANAQQAFGESPRHFMIEVKMGPYLPLVDRSFTSPGPFTKTFGTTPLILAEVELDFQFFQAFGSAAIGISAGYTEKFGRARSAIDGKSTDAPTGLRLAPIKLLAIYRFDYFALRKSFPLVPYVKAGFVAVPFFSSNGADTETVGNTRGSGVKFGYVGVAGLSLLLDVLDQRLSRDFDNSMGVNHSYLFAEFAGQEVTNFRPPTTGALDFSSRHFMFGLGFEF